MQRRKAYKKLDATNRQLMIANERAEESSRMKVDFIRQVSHEVRTPLNIISGFSQVLATPGMELDSAEMQDISRKMVENSDRITHLIDKMLDLSMMSSHAEIECEDNVRLSEVIAQAIMMSDIHKASHLQFQVQQSPETEQLSIVTNKKAASNVLALLLGNAIKFTHPLAFKGQNTEGRIQHVILSVSTDRQYVTLAVEDTGIGVPPEQAENIFKEFVQLDEYTDGTGIGLSIARSMARHMGGDVVLDTAYTAGARFVMSLPLKHSAGK
jgi:signal transduction histidine kinase